MELLDLAGKILSNGEISFNMFLIISLIVLYSNYVRNFKTSTQSLIDQTSIISDQLKEYHMEAELIRQHSNKTAENLLRTYQDSKQEDRRLITELNYKIDRLLDNTNRM